MGNTNIFSFISPQLISFAGLLNDTPYLFTRPLKINKSSLIFPSLQYLRENNYSPRGIYFPVREIKTDSEGIDMRKDFREYFQRSPGYVNKHIIDCDMTEVKDPDFFTSTMVMIAIDQSYPKELPEKKLPQYEKLWGSKDGSYIIICDESRYLWLDTKLTEEEVEFAYAHLEEIKYSGAVEYPEINCYIGCLTTTEGDETTRLFAFNVLD